MGAFLPKGIEWVIILIVILIIFGPKNLPKLGSALGKTVKNLREGLGGNKKKAEVEKAAQADNAADVKEVAQTSEVIEVEAETVEEAASEPVSEVVSEESATTEAPKTVKRTVVRKKVE